MRPEIFTTKMFLRSVLVRTQWQAPLQVFVFQVPFIKFVTLE